MPILTTLERFNKNCSHDWGGVVGYRHANHFTGSGQTTVSLSLGERLRNSPQCFLKNVVAIVRQNKLVLLRLLFASRYPDQFFHERVEPVAQRHDFNQLPKHIPCSRFDRLLGQNLSHVIPHSQYQHRQPQKDAVLSLDFAVFIPRNPASTLLVCSLGREGMQTPFARLTAQSLRA